LFGFSRDFDHHAPSVADDPVNTQVGSLVDDSDDEQSPDKDNQDDGQTEGDDTKNGQHEEVPVKTAQTATGDDDLWAAFDF